MTNKKLASLFTSSSLIAKITVSAFIFSLTVGFGVDVSAIRWGDPKAGADHYPKSVFGAVNVKIVGNQHASTLHGRSEEHTSELQSR